MSNTHNRRIKGSTMILFSLAIGVTAAAVIYFTDHRLTEMGLRGALVGIPLILATGLLYLGIHRLIVDTSKVRKHGEK